MLPTNTEGESDCRCILKVSNSQETCLSAIIYTRPLLTTDTDVG